MVDITMTKCPYCGSPSAGSSRYEYRAVEIGGLGAYKEPLSAVEIYCSECRRTVSIMPVIKPNQ